MVVSAALAAVMVSWIKNLGGQGGGREVGEVEEGWDDGVFCFIFFGGGSCFFFVVCSLGIGKGLGIGKFLPCLQVGMVEGFPGFEIGA